MPGFAQTLKEWKKADLHSGSKTGPVVKSQKQALAIAFSEKRKAAGKKADPSPHVKQIVTHALGIAHHMTKLRKMGHFGPDAQPTGTHKPIGKAPASKMALD